MIKRKLFLLNRSLHRDLGYLSIGLTIVFALSGLALNHRDDWNPNYSIIRKTEVITESLGPEQLIEKSKIKYNIKVKEKGRFWINPNQLKVFYPGDTTLIYRKDQNVIEYESISPRFLLRSFNSLHLNELKGLWVFFSDLYAVILLYLAISAIFMVKGKYGIQGRGGILALIGLFVPILFILIG